MVENIKMSWEDIKNAEVSELVADEKVQVKVNDSKLAKGSFTVERNKDLAVNEAMAQKILRVYMTSIGCKLTKISTTQYKVVDGKYAGKTVCVKVRNNFYNKKGNFTFTHEDLASDLVVIFSYDGNTRSAEWYMAPMSVVSNISDDKLYIEKYWVIPERPVIAASFVGITINL